MSNNTQPAAQQLEPLWSDSRIVQALDDGGIDHDNWLIVKLTMEVIRDEYEEDRRSAAARIAELEAELGQARSVYKDVAIQILPQEDNDD